LHFGTAFNIHHPHLDLKASLGMRLLPQLREVLSTKKEVSRIKGLYLWAPDKLNPALLLRNGFKIKI
jgi:hypothetical protein